MIFIPSRVPLDERRVSISSEEKSIGNEPEVAVARFSTISEHSAEDEVEGVDPRDKMVDHLAAGL